MKKNKLLGNIILFVTAIVWGASFAFQRESAEVTPPFTFNATRIILAAIALWLVTLVMEKTDLGGYSKKKHPEKTTKELWTGGIICGLCLSAGTSLQQIGIGFASAGKSAFLTALYTVLVPLLGWVFFKQKPGARKITGALIAVGGLYLLSVTENFQVQTTDFILVLGAVSFAVQMLCVEKYLGPNNPIKFSAIQFTVVAVTNTALAFIFETPSWEVIQPSMIAILYVGLMSGAVGYTTQIIGQSMTDASIGALIGSLESVFGALFAWLLIDEVMSSRELAGAALMFAAVIIVQLPNRNKT